MKKVNNSIKLNNYLNAQGKPYIPPDEWNNLSAKQKIDARFGFKDFNLFPPYYLWNELTNEEKDLIIKNQRQFIAERIKILHDKFDENPF